MTSVVAWCEDAGVVLGRGLLAGSSSGGGVGLVLGTVFAFPFGTLLGVVAGAVLGIVPAIVAAPLLAVVHTRVTTALAARGSAALAAVLGMEVWALVLDADSSTCVGWGLVGALVGAVAGPWVVLGPKPPRAASEDRR